MVYNVVLGLIVIMLMLGYVVIGLIVLFVVVCVLIVGKEFLVFVSFGCVDWLYRWVEVVLLDNDLVVVNKVVDDLLCFYGWCEEIVWGCVWMKERMVDSFDVFVVFVVVD